MRRLGAAMVVGALALLGSTAAVPQQQAARVRVEVLARGLVVPWALAFAPDGRLFVTERPGRIRLLARGVLRAEPWAMLPAFDGTAQGWETGLMGLALDPEFARRPFVYACYTERRPDGMLWNRVARLQERDGRGVEPIILLDSIPAADYHDGCRLAFGPDRKLYVTSGDARQEALAQQWSSLAGKVLRLNPDGSIPADNPAAASPVWSLGHRNPQGLAWEPQTHRLFITEHGTGDIDEINIIERGRNYGWPVANGVTRNASYRDPVLVFHVAPSGAAFLASDRYGGWRGSLVVTALMGQRLIRIAVRGDSARVVDDSLLVGYGRLRDVVQGPDGLLYVATSNRDGRGMPNQDDDRVLRLRLVPR